MNCGGSAGRDVNAALDSDAVCMPTVGSNVMTSDRVRRTHPIQLFMMILSMRFVGFELPLRPGASRSPYLAKCKQFGPCWPDVDLPHTKGSVASAIFFSLSGLGIPSKLDIGL